MPPSGRTPPSRVGCALDLSRPRASPVNVWFTGWREPISISGNGKVAWRYTAPGGLVFLTRPDSSNLWQVQCAGDHAAQQYQRQNRGCGMVNIHDAMQAAQHRARPQKRSRCGMHRDRENRHRAGPPQLYLTRPDRPLQQRSIADRNRAKPPPERGEHAAANDVAAVVVVVGSTVRVVVVRISVIIRGVIRRIEPVA
jgi:hypothetical protein